MLATGTGRQDWRSAWQGVLSAVVTVAIIVAALGPALTLVPLQALRLVVGGLLLVLGLQWLRKSDSASQRVPRRAREAAIFQAEAEAARVASAQRRGAITDWYAFTLSFKGVLLDGFEPLTADLVRAEDV